MPLGTFRRTNRPEVPDLNAHHVIPAKAGIHEGAGEGKMEATGGFEPPNRGFANPRLRPLGYVASELLILSPRKLEPTITDFAWCREWDSNPHALSSTTPST